MWNVRVLSCLLGLLATVSVSLGDMLPAWIYPVESANQQSQWVEPEGMPALKRVVDEQTGRWCLQYAETSPLSARSFYTEFDRGDLADHDTLRFAWKLTEDMAMVRVTVHGWPGADQRRNYYLNKRPVQPGQWQEVWLDLYHDDDGGQSQAPPGKVRVEFTVRLWDMGELSENPRVVLRVADLRFEQHPVRLQGHLDRVTNIVTSDRIGQRYPFTLHNRTDRPQQVRLSLDPGAMRVFSVDLPKQPVTLEPGESRELVAAVTVPAQQADQLGAMFNEQASLFAAVEEAPDHVTTWYQGFMLYRLIGAVPPDVGRYPWFKSPHQRELALLRIERYDGARAAFDQLIKQAEQLLTISPLPPDVLHGNPNHFFDTRTSPRSQLRFHGPGRIWSERAKAYLTEADLAELPANVQRAVGYAHHQYLTRSARTLAIASWLTGREDFARQAADILLAYAQRYPDYPRMNEASVAFHSRVGWAMLQESWWFDPVPEAFDLVRASGVLTDKEDQQIVNGLIVPAMLTIRSHRVAANQHAEVNASFGRAALLAKRWDQAAEALDGELGMRVQWQLEFDADGLTMEREMPYHFAALKPFVEFAECLESLGVTVFDPSFKRLFDAPLAYTIDQQVGGRSAEYDAAYHHYNDPAYLPQVRAGRQSRWTLAALMSPVELPSETGDAFAYSNSVMEASGYTVLRSGNTPSDLRAVTMNWGSPSHRGGNVMLNPEIVWQGKPLNQQVKRIAYGYENSGFSYTAAAGNALLVDGQRHSMLRADQVAVLGGDTPAGRWTSPRHRPLIAGMQWSRTAAIVGDTVLILDQVASDTPRRLDWLTYLPGNLMPTSADTALTWESYEPLLEQADGYQYLLEPQVATQTAGPIDAAFSYVLGPRERKPQGLLMLQSSASQLMQAKGYIHWHPRLVPVILQRSESAQSAWFVSAYTGRTDPQAPVTVRRHPVYLDGRSLAEHEALAVEVINPAGRYIVLTSSLAGEHQVGEHRMQGPLSVVHVSKNQ